MQVKTIPQESHLALMAILRPYVSEITPTILLNALKSYEPEKMAGQIEKPLSKQEVAGLLGVSIPTVDRLLKVGALKRINAPGLRCVRIERKSVMQYLEG